MASRDQGRDGGDARTAADGARAVLELVDGLDDGFFVLDREWRFVYLNRRAAASAGAAPEALVGRNIWETFPALVGTPHEAAYRKAMEERLPAALELSGVLSDRWYRLRVTPSTVGISVVWSDITDRRRAEESLRASEQKFAKAFHVSTAAMAITRLRDGLFVEVNDRYLELTRFRREDVVGKTSLSANIWKDSQDRKGFVRELERNGTVRNGEYRFLGPTGQEWIGLVSAQVSELEGEQVVISSITDITERKRGEEALLEANRRKDEFLGMLSHELRNPLAPIRNSVYVLEHAQPGSEQASRARAVLRRQSEHLTRLVDDLLDVTRIARGKIELRRSRTDLREAVWRAAEDFRLMMDERGVAFRTSIPDEKTWADVDPTRINQVVGNLLHNAAKYTRRGDEVALSLRADRGLAEIRVRDTGAGIEAPLLPHVFEPFVQGDRTLSRTEGGLGLGLALVKGIVELHGGEVQVESAGIGKGAEFVVRFPLHEGAAAVVHGPAGALAANGSRRVLVVDDNVDAAETLADLLRLLGHEVEVAHDGPGALEKLRAGAPEVVFCDIGLPGMSGYEVARAMRASNGDDLQLVALTGYAQAEDVKRAIEAGFDAHVAKPPDLAEIEKLLG